MDFEFDAELWYWRGPAPWYFLTVGTDAAAVISENASRLTYGWGMIPVAARIGTTEWSTAMFAKDGGYALPVKAFVRRAEGIDAGDFVRVNDHHRRLRQEFRWNV